MGCRIVLSGYLGVFALIYCVCVVFDGVILSMDVMWLFLMNLLCLLLICVCVLLLFMCYIVVVYWLFVSLTSLVLFWSLMLVLILVIMWFMMLICMCCDRYCLLLGVGLLLNMGVVMILSLLFIDLKLICFLLCLRWLIVMFLVLCCVWFILLYGLIIFCFMVFVFHVIFCCCVLMHRDMWMWLIFSDCCYFNVDCLCYF